MPVRTSKYAMNAGRLMLRSGQKKKRFLFIAETGVWSRVFCFVLDPDGPDGREQGSTRLKIFGGKVCWVFILNEAFRSRV